MAFPLLSAPSVWRAQLSKAQGQLFLAWRKPSPWPNRSKIKPKLFTVSTFTPWRKGLYLSLWLQNQTVDFFLDDWSYWNCQAQETSCYPSTRKREEKRERICWQDVHRKTKLSLNLCRVPVSPSHLPARGLLFLGKLHCPSSSAHERLSMRMSGLLAAPFCDQDLEAWALCHTHLSQWPDTCLSWTLIFMSDPAASQGCSSICKMETWCRGLSYWLIPNLLFLICYFLVQII